MLFTRRLSVAAAALLPIAGGFFLLVFTALGARAQNVFGNCEDEVAVLPAPIAPWKGAPLRVLVAAEKPLDGELSLVAPNGNVAVKSHDRQGGPPYFWYVEVAAPAAGTWHATFTRGQGQARYPVRAMEDAITSLEEQVKTRVVSVENGRQY